MCTSWTVSAFIGPSSLELGPLSGCSHPPSSVRAPWSLARYQGAHTHLHRSELLGAWPAIRVLTPTFIGPSSLLLDPRSRCSQPHRWIDRRHEAGLPARDASLS